jgi:hypothetical protein
MQARIPGTPSTITKQSKHWPIPQKSPRCSPFRVVRHALRPVAIKAEATVSPFFANTGTSSISKVIVFPFGSLSNDSFMTRSSLLFVKSISIELPPNLVLIF